MPLAASAMLKLSPAAMAIMLERAPTPFGPQGGSFVPDQFDVSLEDSDLLGEVELTTNLIIAASETDQHLTAAEIDEILGVVPSPPT